jgi:hypothetical protein
MLAHKQKELVITLRQDPKMAARDEGPDFLLPVI